jgi:hydroxymethylpyrimidine/phosphomethylpyrimidine kinase
VETSLNNTKPVRVLTIAGSDSGGGAGIQADLKTFTAYGVFGMSVITAVTAQNTNGVQEVFEIPAKIIASQFDAVAEDIGIDAAKTGMLYSREAVKAVIDCVRRHGIKNLVVDTVMNAKRGETLLQDDARELFIQELMPLALVVTANIPEAEIMTGVTISSLSDMKEAARIIHADGAQTVLVKGGHLNYTHAMDVFYNSADFVTFEEQRIDTKNTHGTGCTLSAAIAANLAKGIGLIESIAEAKKYVTGAIRHSFNLGSGNGPLNHFWRNESHGNR